MKITRKKLQRLIEAEIFDFRKEKRRRSHDDERERMDRERSTRAVSGDSDDDWAYDIEGEIEALIGGIESGEVVDLGGSDPFDDDPMTEQRIKITRRQLKRLVEQAINESDPPARKLRRNNRPVEYWARRIGTNVAAGNTNESQLMSDVRDALSASDFSGRWQDLTDIMSEIYQYASWELNRGHELEKWPEVERMLSNARSVGEAATFFITPLVDGDYNLTGPLTQGQGNQLRSDMMEILETHEGHTRSVEKEKTEPALVSQGVTIEDLFDTNQNPRLHTALKTGGWDEDLEDIYHGVRAGDIDTGGKRVSWVLERLRERMEEIGLGYRPPLSDEDIEQYNRDIQTGYEESSKEMEAERARRAEEDRKGREAYLARRRPREENQ